MVIMTQTLYIQPHSSAVTTAWNVPHHARTHARTHRLASGRQEAELRGSGRKDQSEEEKSEKEGAVDRRM